MVKKNENESVDILHLKIKTLTILVVLLIIWQVISFLRVSSLNQITETELELVNNKVSNIYDSLREMNLELSYKADKSWVKEWCE